MWRLLLAMFLIGLFPLLAGQSRPAPNPYQMTPEEFAGYAPAHEPFNKDHVDIALLEAAIFQETNVERATQHLPAFKYSRRLNAVARSHSREMIALQYFAHDSPVKENKSSIERLRAAGVPRVNAIAENIEMLPALVLGSGHYAVHNAWQPDEYLTDSATGDRVGYYTYAAFAREMLDRWMKSPHHRDNILSPDTHFLGVGCARGTFKKQDSILATQDFAANVGEGDQNVQLPSAPEWVDAEK